MKNFVLVANQIKESIIKAAKSEGLKVNANMLNVNAVQRDGVHSVMIGSGKHNADLFAGKWKTETAFKRNVLLPENIAAMVGIIRNW
ncbi:hypothetical protein R4036_004595 [Salmonella enterica]|nr:hypothetical protein [Salmonella enterica]